MNLREGGLSSRARVAIAIWGIGVIVVVKFLYETLQITGATLAVVAIIIAAVTFYGIFLQLWQRLPEDWRRQ